MRRLIRWLWPPELTEAEERLRLFFRMCAAQGLVTRWRRER